MGAGLVSQPGGGGGGGSEPKMINIPFILNPSLIET